MGNESLSKLPIYAALGVPEIWRYDGGTVLFYALTDDTYRDSPEGRFFPGLTPAMLQAALDQSKTEGQTAALRACRRQWRGRSPAPPA